MTFLFWNHSIIAQHVFTSTQSASPRDWVLNCIYVSLFIHSFIHLFIFFLLLFICFTLFTLTKYDISVLKSFNNSPACIYFHSKCLTARLSFELYLCLFIYSFIHLFVFFFTIIFVSLNLIYINQVWHFCFEIVQKYTPIYFHSKCVTAT